MRTNPIKSNAGLEEMEIVHDNIKDSASPGTGELKRKREEKEDKKAKSDNKSAPNKMLRPENSVEKDNSEEKLDLKHPFLGNIYHLQNKPIKEKLYKILFALQDHNELKESNTWAESQGIFKCLERIFGDEAYIIHPDLSSIHSPVDNNDISGAVNYIEAIEEKIKADGGELKKPIIAIWNTESIKQEDDNVDFNAEGGNHWQTLVILPKNHKIYNGKSLTNERELVFFKDSYYKGKSIPYELIILFKNKVSFERNFKEGEVADNPTIVLGGMLANAEIYDEEYKNTQQQEDGYDCGWWAVYNAFMFVMEGNDKFLAQFTSPRRELGYKLREIFSTKGLDLTQQAPFCENETQKDWLNTFELAFKNILIDKLKQKDQKAFKILGDNIKQLNSHYLSIMINLFAENTSLSDVYNTVESIKEEEENLTLEAQNENIEKPGQVYNSIDLRHDVRNELTGDALRKSFHGNIYQLGLLTLAAVRASKSDKKFYLISEAKEFEKFDDLVVDYGDKIIFLQAKHSSKKGRFSEKDFKHEDGDASLAKYFDSWNKLKQGKFVLDVNGRPKKTQFIFFTNKHIEGMDGYLEEKPIGDDEFFIHRPKPLPSYRFIKGDTRKDFIEVIIKYSKTIEVNTLKVSDLELANFTNEIAKAIKVIATKLDSNDQTIELNGSNVKPGKNEKFDRDIVLAIIKLALEDDVFILKLKINTPNEVWNKVKGKFKVTKELDALTILSKKQIISNIDKTLIDQFLDELIIKIAQPNVDELLGIIKEEIGSQVNIGVHESYTGIMQLMLGWLKERHGCVLSSEKFGQWQEITKADLNRFYFLRFTKVFEEEFNSYPLNLKGLTNKKLFEFLNPTNTVSKFQIIRGNSAKPIIFNTVKQIQNLKDDQWIYIEYSHQLAKDVLLTLKGGSTKFLIVDFNNLSKINKQQIRNIHNLIQNKDRVKIILLIRGNVTIPDELLKLYPQENILEALSDAQIKELCNPYKNKYISLAGKEYKIEDIINSKIGSIYELMKNIEYLAEVIEHTYTQAIVTKSEMPYGVYVSNQMVRGEVYYDLSIITKIKTKCYIIEGIEYNTLLIALEKLFEERKNKKFAVAGEEIDSDANYILLKDSKSNIDSYKSKTLILIQRPVNLSDREYIVLKSVEGFNTERLKVTENPSNLYLPFSGGIDFTYQADQDEFIKSITANGQLSVLMSPAGYGKSSFCINIVEKHLSCKGASLPIWVIKIPLPKLNFDNGKPILAPFTNTNYKWQYEAFQLDLEKKGAVLIILDGFDEIKDVKIIDYINNWIKGISQDVSLLVTTRQYAANKLILPLKQNTVFYKLIKYTEEQRKEYIIKYIKAILDKKPIEAKELSRFIDKILDIISMKLNEHSSRILGIPLESYIFCELLKPHILAYLAKNENQLPNDDLGLNQLDISNTAKLFQEFILSKSMLFLKKHLLIKPENISKKSMIFNLMGSYNQVIELYALKQAFVLNDITEHLSSINFDINSLETLDDTGLLRVTKDGSKLNFSHETYQEFYAAMTIIRGLLIGKGSLYTLTKELVQQNRYDPKFNFIFSLAAQFSVSAGSMIPGYSIEKHLLSFWEILGENGDIIGAGATRLFKNCLAGFTGEQVKILLYNIKDKKWAKFIKNAINTEDKQHEGHPQEYDSNELPISILDIDEDDSTNIDLGMSKHQVARTVRLLRKKDSLDEEKVKKLEETADNHKMSGDYWALDGGIEAIGFTGKFFSKNLADFLILRARCWQNNEAAVILALGEIYRSLDAGDNIAKVNCFYTIKQLVNNIRNNNKHSLVNLLYRVDPEYIHYLINDLKSMLKSLENINIDEYLIHLPHAILNKAFETIKNILSIAEKLQYAVTLEANKIVLTKGKKITINFEEGVISNVLAKVIFDILKGVYNSDYSEDWMDKFKFEEHSILYEIELIREEHEGSNIHSTQAVNDSDMCGEGSLKLDEHYREFSLTAKFYNKYYKYGLDELLLLRLRDANIQGVAALPAFKLDSHTLNSILVQVTEKLDQGFSKVIVPCNIKDNHWIGILLEIGAESFNIIYLDSEQGELVPNLKEQLTKYFQNSYKEVVITEGEVDKQKYNNCGPEVIENFIKFLGKERLPQDESVFHHSLILEQYLLNFNLESFDSTLLEPFQVPSLDKQSAINNLLNFVDIPLRKVDQNTELSLQIANRVNSKDTPIKESNFIKRLDKYVENYLKILFLPNKFHLMQEIANKHKINIKVVDSNTLKQAFHKIALKTHPDKYSAATEDFIKAKQLIEQINDPISTELYKPIMEQLREFNIIVKGLDVIIEAVRTFKDPSLENTLKATIGCIQLASIYAEMTNIIFPITAIGSLYQAYQGNYWESTMLITKSIGFTLMFSTVYAAAPALSVVLSAGFTGYAVYSTINNGYNLYNEFLDPDQFNSNNLSNVTLTEFNII